MIEDQIGERTTNDLDQALILELIHNLRSDLGRFFYFPLDTIGVEEPTFSHEIA